MSEYLPIANGYHNVDIQVSIPDGYQHVSGKRLQPLCRKLNLPYANALVGWTGTTKYPKPKLDGVVVSVEEAPNLIQAISEREARSEKKRLQHAKKQKQVLEQRRGEQRQAFMSKYPDASEETIAAHSLSVSIFGTLGEVPLEKLTEDEISDLHLVMVNRSGVLLMDGGKTVVPLFRAALPKNDLSATPEEVHRKAMAMGFSAPKALWAANKLVKMVEAPQKMDVYELKDKLLQHWRDHLIDGRVARFESRTCWSCDGDGQDRYGEECYRCDGTGVYSSNTLYESRYQFPGDARVYCFHGYTKPEMLSEEPGADKQSYGYRLTPDERKSIPFGLHDLIKIMRHELVLLEEARKRKQHDELLAQWTALGLPAITPDKPEAQIRECLKLIHQLIAG